MTRSGLSDGPAVCLWLIRAVSLLVPRSKRQVWTQRRLDEARQYRAFLQERSEPPAVVRVKLRGFCRQALRDGFRERFPDAEPRVVARRLARGPAFFLTAASVLLLSATLATGFLSGLRALYSPLPYPDAGHLVSCYQVHFLSLSWGVQARYIRPWQEKSQTLAGRF
jgi:hypothetical protein